MKSRTTPRTVSSRYAYRLLSGLLGLVLAVMGHMSMAQTFSATIAGTVTDPTGAMISGATLQLQNMDTKDIHNSKSSSNGSYVFNNLLPGTYQITAAAPGFKDYLHSNMLLRANTSATVDISMQIGGSEQQVVVSAESVLVDTESANNSVTMDSVLIEGLPNNTLNPLNFVYDLAGTTEAQGGMTSRSQSYDQFGSTFGINGGRTAESEILIDGAPSTAIDWGGLMVSPIEDSVQEQQVVTNEYDPQYERGGEGVVTLVTKNGSDHIHGEIYDFMRNSSLDAAPWANGQAGVPKGKFHRNQFGANVSGPIWRRKHVYFFAAYEGLRQPDTFNSGYMTVPTAAERMGDFSQTYLPTLGSNGQPVLDVIYNPFTTTQVTDSTGTHFTRQAFQGNIIPGGFDPVGLKALSLYPLPNRPGTGPALINNYYAQGSGLTENDKFDWRVDWAQSAKHRIFVRMSDRVRENDTPACFFCNGADNEQTNDDHGFQLAINDTVTPNSSWVIDTYGGATRWWEGQTAIGNGVANAQTIGLSPDLFQVNQLPVISAGQYTQLGGGGYNRYVRYLYTGIINATKQFHQHTIKFGFNYDVAMINNRADSPGSFGFANDQTSCDPNPGGSCSVNLGTSLSGNPIASLLLGIGSGGGVNTSMDPAMSAHTFGLYVEDSWRATPRLTVFGGLRYENQRPATERHNRVAYFDPNAVNPLSTPYGSTILGAFEFAGVDGRGRNEWEADNLNFGPRLGLAYRLTNKLAIRGGSGIFYGPASAMLSYDGGGQSPGYTAYTPWTATQNQNGYLPGNPISNPYPNGLNQPTGNSSGGLTYVGYGAGQVWIKGPHPTGEIYQWSTDLQYQVSAHSVAEIGYTGVRGRRLLYGNPNLDFDQLPTQDLSMGSALSQLVPNPYAAVITDPNSYLSAPTVAENLLLRPYPIMGYLQQTRSTPGARSQFDAFDAKFNHSFANGLSSITTYRWSKDLDNGSEALLGWTNVDSWRDARNTKLDYSLSTHDIPQSFAEAAVYQLPFGSGRRFGGDDPWIVRQTLGGWNVSTAIRLASGLPIPQPVSFYNNPLSYFGFPGAGLPNVTGNPALHRSVAHWINAAAFSAPDDNTGATIVTCDQGCQPFPFQYGNEPRTMSTLREAATKNLDMGVSKVFGPVNWKTEFRADFLNVFNHPIYGGSYNIDTCLNCGTVGNVYGTRNDPRNIQLSLKISH